MEDNLLELFVELDKKDGIKDGKINCELLRNFLDEESELQKKLGLKRCQLETILLKADRNNDGFIDKEEFMSFAKRLKLKKSKSIIHMTMFKNYTEKLAFAEEYKCWPPKLFIPIITILQIIFFAMNRYHYPDKLEPKCSYFILL